MVQQLENPKKHYHNAKIGKISSQLLDIVGNDVTVRRKPVANDDTHTLFKEIEVLPYEQVLDMNALGRLKALKFKNKNTTEEKFISEYINAFQQSIYENWDSNKVHIVFHSSGYDSRILSGLILNLYKRFTDCWLGQTVFVCMYPEEDYTKPMLNYFNDQGMNIPTYFYNPGTDWINFEKAGRYLNGSALYPVNTSSMAIEHVKKATKKYANKGYQVFSAGFHNEMFDFGFLNGHKNNPVELFLKKYYYYRYAQFVSAIKEGIIYPLLNPVVLQTIIESDIELNMDIRLKVMKTINERLYKIPRMPDKDVKRSKVINDKVRTSIHNDYKNSWYGKNIKPLELSSVPNQKKVNDFWYHWSAASCCEYLKQKGVNVK